MDKQLKDITKFPKGFFTNIKSNNASSSKNPEKEKTFIWSKNVLSGKSKVKLVALKKEIN